MAVRRRGALLPGEVIERSVNLEREDAAISDVEINRRYEKGEIRIITEQARYPLATIPDLVKSDNYILNPEFQRRHRWSISQKSRLIESFIMNVPIPPIFLYETEYSRYEVMDGLQRLSAINDFYDDDFALADLEEWPDLNGRKYSSLPRQIQRGVDRRYLSSIILLQETAKSEYEAQRLKQIVFERINSGGVSLSPQESRNAIFDGPMNRLCMKLARSPAFCDAWDIPDSDDDGRLGENSTYRTMQDVELVLRFFANRQRTYRRDQQNFKLFLDYYLNKANEFDVSVLKELRTIFLRTINLIIEIFGNQAFWLYRNRNGRWSWLKRPTTAVYDPMMYVFSQYLDQNETLAERTEIMRQQIQIFYQKYYSLFEGRNTNPSVLNAREEAFHHFIAEMI